MARQWLVLLLVCVIAALGGCAFQREFKEPDVKALAVPPQVPATIEAAGSGEIDLGRELGVSPSTFLVQSTRPLGGALPDILVHGLSVTESGLQDALQMVLAGTGWGLHLEGGPRALERGGPVTLQGLTGSLRDVMDRLAGALGFFWYAQDGVLTIEPDRQFVIELPPVLLGDDSLAGMTNMLQALGAKDVYLDRMGRSLAFRANARGLGQIEQYMARVRETRSMVVYELQVYQVDLTDASQQGVDWTRLGASSLERAKPISATSPVSSTAATDVASDLAKAFALTQSGSGLGAVIRGPKFDIDALISFLRTQGTVKTVSQPRLAMLSGAKGMLRVGQSTTFVSKVGSSLSSGVSQVTVETRDLRTGLELALVGEESDRTVYTRVSLSLSELLRFRKYTALGTDLTLPEVADRDLQTAIRLPPGYSAILGGITVERQGNDRGIGASTNTSTTEVTRSELIIVLKPTVVRFGRSAPSAAAPSGRSN